MAHYPKVVVSVGTRPEAIKLGPVVEALDLSTEFDTLVVCTGQHREMLQGILDIFGIQPRVNLAIMEPDQSLNQIVSRITSSMEEILKELRPDIVLVQGDTSSAFASALAAFYCKVPVFHVEAGLRTRNPYLPFPEEANRKLISAVASVHFAPTKWARKNLLDEKIPEDIIYVTGNPVIDAVKKMEGRESLTIKEFVRGLSNKDHKIVLVTSHRRESWGEALHSICVAVNEVAVMYPGAEFVFPMHMNPRVVETVKSVLSCNSNVHLLPPLEYPDLLHVLKNSALVMTDSGGIQEEATYYDTPLIVLRDQTERPEIIYENRGYLVGTDKKRIVEEVVKTLTKGKSKRYSETSTPFGDGFASDRIRLAIERFVTGRAPLLEAGEQFSTRTFDSKYTMFDTSREVPSFFKMNA